MKRIYSVLLFVFVAGQALALAVGWQFILQQLSVVENPDDVGNAVNFLAYVLVAAVVLLLVLKFYSGKLFFQALEFGLIFFSTFLVMGLFADGDTAMLLGVAAGAVRFFRPSARYYLIIFSASVAGALLGASLGILPAVAFAALLSIYDFLAVFHTKHMVALAQGLSSRGANFSVKITAPASPAKIGGSKASKGNKNKGVLPTESIELGTGDFVIPSMISVSAIKLSLLQAYAAFAGSVLGVLVLLWFLEKRRGYFPALPPIVGGSLLLLGIATLAKMVLGA